MTNNNLLRGALIIMICLFGTYVFLYPPSADASLNEKPAPNDTIVSHLDSASVCLDYKQLHYSSLKTGLVRDMVTLYRSNQLKAIQAPGANQVSDDAYSIWFDLDTIKKFIYHIEKGVLKNGSANKKLGLRLYYAAYPDKKLWTKDVYPDLAGFIGNSETELYEKKHTLVIIPTISHGTASTPAPNLDFNPFVAETYTNGIQPAPVSDNPEQSVDDPTRNDPVMALTASDNPNDPSARDNPTVARNHGNLYPPGNASGVGF